MTGTRTLCLTDVVGSTRLAAELGDQRNAALWDAHDALARALVAEHRGTELERTDGIMVLFETPGDALAFAVAYHRVVRTLDPPLQARAGIHTGPVVVRPNPAAHVARGAKRLEVDGLAIAITARVMSIALGGQTLVTFAPETDLRTVSHGHWHLKGVSEPVEVFEVGDAAAPFRPPPDGEKAFRVVQAEGRWLPVREVPHALPRLRDPFVGRAADLASLASRLDGGSLVTVVGPAGAGKTRLAVEYAWAWLGEWPGGAWCCDLSGAHGLDDIAAAVAAVVGGPLEGRGRCLLILDRAEGVVSHLTELLATWLDRAPEVVFLATSRLVLGMPGEVVLALPPLPVHEAVTLFLRRAEAANRNVHAAAADRATVEAIVERLGRWPAPIELAAGRARTSTPEELLAQLSADTRVVTLVFGAITGASDLQRTLGDRAAASLFAAHGAVVRATLATFPDGEALETGGDPFVALFSRPSDAVRFAVVARENLRAWSRGLPTPVVDRFLVHLGEVVVVPTPGAQRADGSTPKTLTGAHVDLGTRLVAAGEPDRILLTRPVYDNARPQLLGRDLEGVGGLVWWMHGPCLLPGIELDLAEVGVTADAVPPAPTLCVPRPEGGARPPRRWVGAGALAGVAAIGLVVAGLAVGPAVEDAPVADTLLEVAPLPPPVAPVALAVVLYGDSPSFALPDPDDLVARRTFLAHRVLPALVAARPRAILLDFTFELDADEASTAALSEALRAARRDGVPVLAARPHRRASLVPVCGPATAGEACLLALTDVSVPTGEVRGWPMCVDDRMTLGLAAARLLRSPAVSGDWARDTVCAPDPVPLHLPPDEPCAAPWKRLWLSELLTGRPYDGIDPVDYGEQASCGATGADLADRVVIVSDPRRSDAGRDVVSLGDVDGGPLRAYAGAEVHAVVAWNLAGALE